MSYYRQFCLGYSEPCIYIITSSNFLGFTTCLYQKKYIFIFQRKYNTNYAFFKFPAPAYKLLLLCLQHSHSLSQAPDNLLFDSLVNPVSLNSGFSYAELFFLPCLSPKSVVPKSGFQACVQRLAPEEDWGSMSCLLTNIGAIFTLRQTSNHQRSKQTGFICRSWKTVTRIRSGRKRQKDYFVVHQIFFSCYIISF